MMSIDITKTTPFAPDVFNGEYKLKISGRQMKLTKLDDGTKVRATCHKEDEWDMMSGIDTLLNKLVDKKEQEEKDHIKVGDKVRVIDSGKSYPYYDEWVTKHVKNPALIAKFCYAKAPEEGCNYEVVAIAPHDNKYDTKYGDLAYIKEPGELITRCYLISVDGLKKID